MIFNWFNNSGRTTRTFYFAVHQALATRDSIKPSRDLCVLGNESQLTAEELEKEFRTGYEAYDQVRMRSMGFKPREQPQGVPEKPPVKWVDLFAHPNWIKESDTSSTSASAEESSRRK